MAIDLPSNTSRFKIGQLRYPVLAATLALLLASCDASDTTSTDDDPLLDLQVVAIDFELNSIVLTNEGTEPVRTEGLHLCQEGDCMEFNIFTIAPRATILFNVARVGGVDSTSGEVVLHRSEAYEDPGSVVDYVAWGAPGQAGVAAAAAAELWNEADFVPTAGDTIILSKVDPAAIGSDAWQASAEIS